MDENKREKSLLEPVRAAREIYIDFELLRNNVSGWLRVWKMTVPKGCPCKADFLKFGKKEKKKDLLI